MYAKVEQVSWSLLSFFKTFLKRYVLYTYWLTVVFISLVERVKLFNARLDPFLDRHNNKQQSITVIIWPLTGREGEIVGAGATGAEDVVAVVGPGTRKTCELRAADLAGGFVVFVAGDEGG